MSTGEISTDFPFTKQHVPVLDSKIAYVDTGRPPSNPALTVIFLRGNPASSYIYRNIIPHVSPIAHCIALDLVGFSASGKMPSNSYYVRDHIRYLAAFMDAVLPANTPDSDKLFFIIQDWGSTLGFNWAPGSIFKQFRTEGVRRKLLIDENAFIEVLLAKGSTARAMTEAETDHYRAPFLSPKDLEPIYRFPNEIPFDRSPLDVAGIVEQY